MPDEQQRESFRSGIIAEMAIPSGVQDLIRSFPTSAHPMAIISAAIQALSTHRADQMDPLDADQVASATQGLIAALPTIAAYSHRHTVGQSFIAPNPELGYVENFLTMMFADEDFYVVSEDDVTTVAPMSMESVLMYKMWVRKEKGVSKGEIEISMNPNMGLVGKVSVFRDKLEDFWKRTNIDKQ